MKYGKLNTDDNVFLSIMMVASSMALGFMLACVVKPMPEDTLIERDVEPISAEVEVIEVEYPAKLPAVDVDKQREVAIHEAKRITANRIGIYDDYEMALMARVVRAEAGNQDDVGKRLVVDCILNRLDSDAFPDTIEEVVTQKNQFASYQWYTEDDLDAVADEIVDRTDDEIVFFRTEHYSAHGNPAYQYGDHYFSTE